VSAITNSSRHMSAALAEYCQRSTRIRFAVSFIMESGVKVMLDPLQRAAEKNTPIEIITGTYMNVTEPSALYLLRHKLGDRLQLKLFQSGSRSFHPKAYFFDHDQDSTLFVGSSNLSRSALITGVEWNYALRRTADQVSFTVFEEAYAALRAGAIEADDVSLRRYAKGWRKPKQIYQLDNPEDESIHVLSIVEPRGAQIEALYELHRTREDGFDKALVVAATGLGKTYLAAFDSLNFSRVLFVAHREEILKQAEESFRTVRPSVSTGFFTGAQKDTASKLIFASVQTLGRADYLTPQYFTPDAFDYLVVDEFHHAAAGSYRGLLDYFKPKFLLGLTATPDRMDNKDIYALCEQNVAYEVSLKGAINRDWLVPFRYYGIYDATNYDAIDYRHGTYDLEQLENSLTQSSRAGLVYDHYLKHRRKRSLGFCASIKHAEYMADFFAKKGVRACCVTSSGSSPRSMDRQAAIAALKAHDIDVIFSVDIFNEGVDIPAVDLVMFLRPTESYTVFMQQLGRGLRKSTDKEHLVVLDFIGNYRKAHFKPGFLSGSIGFDSEQGVTRFDMIDLPDGCLVDFDWELIDLFKRMESRAPIKTQLIQEYQELCVKLGHRPTREEVNLHGAFPFRMYYAKFDSWLLFLNEVQALEDMELAWLGTPAEKFLREIERTSMTKSYKVPTIMTFLKAGVFVPNVTLDKIGRSFMDFYNVAKHQVDLRDKRHSGWRDWSLSKYMKLAEDNPVHFLSQGRNQFFRYDAATRVFSIMPEMEPYLSPRLAEHVADILKYKAADYFCRHY